jgi:hypothetical protein
MEFYMYLVDPSTYFAEMRYGILPLIISHFIISVFI